jgi:hypothetical protein
LTARDEWRWTDEQGVQRLVRTEELRAAIAGNVLPPSTLIWREGMKEWVPAFTVPEFAEASTTDDVPEFDRSTSTLEPRFGGTIPGGEPSPPQRKPSQTLLGLEAPTADDDRETAIHAPIFVPSGAGEGARPSKPPITLRPDYYGAAAPEFPRPPRPPSKPPSTGPGKPSPAAASPARSPSPPVRVPLAIDIDGGWLDKEEPTHNDDRRSRAEAPGVIITPSATPAKPSTSASAPRPAAAAAPRPTKSTPPPNASAGDKKPAERCSTLAAAPAAKAGATPAPSPAKSLDTSSTSINAGKLGVKAAAAKPKTEGPARESAAPAATVPRVASDKVTSPPRAGGLPRPAASPKTPVPSAALVPPPVPAEPEIAASVAAPQVADLPPPPPPADAPVVPSLPSPSPPRAHVVSATEILLPPVTSLKPQSAPPDFSDLKRPLSEISRTVRIEGLLAQTSSPLPPDVLARPAAANEPAAFAPTTGPEQSSMGALPPPSTPNFDTQQPPPIPMIPMPVEPAVAEPLIPRSPALATLAQTSPARGFPATRPPSSFPRPASPVSVPVASLLVAGGALITMVIMAFFVGRCSAGPGEDQRPVVRAALADVARAGRDAIPPPPKPCWVAKQPVRWAPVVSQRIPFELLPTAAGKIAIGYAKNSKDAIGIEVTPSSGQMNKAFVEKASGDIERVMPTGTDKGFFVAMADAKGPLRSIIQVPASTPFFVGMTESGLATADAPDAAPALLWPIASNLEATRVIVADDKGSVLTFRREGAIWGGFIGPDRKPVGEIVKIQGGGGQVGKPFSGWNGRELAITFAERTNDESPWKIRMGHSPPGAIPTATEIIELPAGGPGGDANAPGITGLPDGRWLLIWTEGSAGSKAVRAQTLGPDFAPVGDPIALSPPAGNFGQGVLSVAGGYVTAVFLSKGKSNYELWGGILQCG